MHFKKSFKNSKDFSCGKISTKRVDKEENRFLKELGKLRRLIMATKQEVLDAIEAEKNEVLSEIQKLKDQIANGSPVTAADLDDIVNAVKGIVVPTE